MIGVRGIEATILWRGRFGGRGGAGNLGEVAGLGPICSIFQMLSIVFCLFFSPWLSVCFFVPFGCQVDAKEVQKRSQGHPFGQQKLTKLALDHGSENMAPVQ